MTPKEFKVWQISHYTERLQQSKSEAERRFLKGQLNQLTGKVSVKIKIGIERFFFI